MNDAMLAAMQVSSKQTSKTNEQIINNNKLITKTIINKERVWPEKHLRARPIDWNFLFQTIVQKNAVNN